MQNKIVYTFATLVGALALSGCGKSDSSSLDSYDTTSAEVVGSSIAGAASSSDDSGGSTVASLEKSFSRSKALYDLLFPKANAAVCAAANVAEVKTSTCTGADMTLTFGGCTVGTNTFTGALALVFSSAGVCTSAHTNGILNMGAAGAVTITSSAGFTRTLASGAYVETDSASSGYSVAKTGGLTITCVDATCGGGGAGASRTVQILGLHRAEYNAAATKLLDHTISTSTSLTVNGTTAAADKAISAGVIVLQHNIAQYTATSTIASPLTFSSTCCWPTGGSLNTVFSGSRTGTETVEFGACGTATANGHAVTFTHCR